MSFIRKLLNYFSKFKSLIKDLPFSRDRFLEVLDYILWDNPLSYHVRKFYRRESRKIRKKSVYYFNRYIGSPLNSLLNGLLNSLLNIHKFLKGLGNFLLVFFLMNPQLFVVVVFNVLYFFGCIFFYS